MAQSACTRADIERPINGMVGLRPLVGMTGRAGHAAVQRAEHRLQAARGERDALIRRALDDGASVGLVSRLTDVTRTGIRKIVARPEDDQ